MEPSAQIEACFFPTYGERVRTELMLLVGSPPLLIASLAFPVAGLALLGLLIASPELSSLSSWLAVVGCWAFTPFFFVWNSVKAHRVSREKGPYTYRFSATGVHIGTPLVSSEVLWPAVIRVRAHDGILLLYLSKRCAQFVPLRALPGPSDVAEIEAFALAGGVARVGT